MSNPFRGGETRDNDDLVCYGPVSLQKNWNFMEATEAIGSCCPNLGLGAPFMTFRFPNGSAICKIKMALPTKKINSRLIP